jgi:hypothetical protein
LEDKNKQQILFPWIALIALAIGGVLWFNRFSMSKMQMGDGISVPIRMNRFTGDSEMLLLGKWVPVNSSSSTAQSGNSALDSIDVSKIQGRGGFTQDPYNGHSYSFTANLYNGTNHSLSEVVVQLIVSNTSTQDGFNREYSLRAVNGNPVLSLSSGDFAASVGICPQAGTWTWQVLRASTPR